MSRQRPHVEGCRCFGCKVSSLGVFTQRMRQETKDPVKKTKVICEEGPGRGQVAGYHTEHWKDNVDATVLAPQVRIGTTEVRDHG